MVFIDTLIIGLSYGINRFIFKFPEKLSVGLPVGLLVTEYLFGVEKLEHKALCVFEPTPLKIEEKKE